jgi:acetylornithine deacetylase/succinyl-diaminopimelate desuccinylase-like protein
MAAVDAGSPLGAEFLVREHAELFAGVRYAIGEFGGFRMAIGGRSFYPIMVAEKQLCWSTATLRGPAGHGSMPVRGGAMGSLGRLLERIDRKRLPVHVPAVTRAMVDAIAGELPAPAAVPLRGLLRPALTDRVLAAMGERGRVFDPLLHNTVSATIVAGGEKINVIPDEVTVQLDGRLLPGLTPELLFAELRALTGVEMELEVVRHDPVAAEPDMGMFDGLAAILRELDPAAKPIPLLLPGVTDGRFFARLGIQTYGFLPMQMPAEMPFMQLIHAPDERIPVEAVEFGTRAIERALERF